MASRNLSGEFKELAIWLGSAARIFRFRVLGFSVSGSEEKQKTSPKVLKRENRGRKSKSNILFRKGSKRQKIHERLQTKKGVGLIVYITERYQSGLSPNAIDREIIKITRVKWSLGNSRDIIDSHKINR